MGGFWLIVFLCAALSTPFAEIYRRLHAIRTFKMMFPDRKIQWQPIFYNVSDRCVPYGPRGRQYLRYQKRAVHVTLAYMIFMFALVAIVPRLFFGY